MRRARRSLDNNVVNISALDIFANSVGALAFLLLLFAANAIELARPTTLKILTQRLPVSQAESEYIGILSAIGGVPPYSWTIHSGTLPEGLKLDQERGEIVGIPNPAAGGQSFPFAVMVSDSREKWVRADLEIRVLSAKSVEEMKTQPLILLTHGDLPDAFEDKFYQIYLSARGGSGRYRWSAERLPSDFTVDSTSGLLKGTPQVSGHYEMVLRVRDEEEGSGDAGNAVATASLRVLGSEMLQKITGVEASSRILTENLPPAIEAEPYEVTLAGTGTAPLQWSAQNLPPGLNIDEAGVIRGIPISAMTARILVSMEDAHNVKAPNKMILLMVKPKQHSPWERAMQRGLWVWLGYPLLGLFEIAFLYILRRKEGHEVAIILKQHGVDLIQKADGTTALNGPPEAMEAVRQRFRSMRGKHDQYKMISYVVLTMAIVGYSIFLFG